MILPIYDQQRTCLEISVLAIQGYQLLACFCFAYANNTTLNRISIKGMQRLTVLQHDIVGNVYNVVDRTNSSCHKTILHPLWRDADSNVGNISYGITAAQLISFDFDGNSLAGRLHNLGQLLIRLRQVYVSAQNRSNFIGCTQHTKAVGSVRRKIEIQHLIIQSEQLCNWSTDFGALRQNKDALLLLFRKQLVIQTKLLCRADHPLGENAAQLGLLNIQPSWKLRANKCHRHDLTSIHIFCTADDLQFFILTGVYDTYIQLIGIRMLLLALHIASDNFSYSFIPVLNGINLNTRTGNLLR
ncbi:hypothetical protein D3C77_382110 [compost metagenome]